jgi:alkylation response protein AidB-like acyl-CoA dehydrogenase
MPGWTTAFKAIPWLELMAAAPTVVQGARRLWATVRKQEAPVAEGQDPLAAQRALENQIAELRQELTAASELVTNLAEQNGRLVEAIAILRVRTRVLLVFSALLAAGLIGVAALVLTQ